MIGYTYTEEDGWYEIRELHLVEGMTRLGMTVARCFYEEDAQYVAAAMSTYYEKTKGNANDA